MIKKIRIQIIYILIGFVNFLLTFIPTFTLKRIIIACSGIDVDQNTTIHRGVRIFSFGRMRIGKNTVINNNCFLDNRACITIGNNVSIAHNTKIYTMGHDVQSPLFLAQGKPVIISDYVVTFSNVLILPGVTLGKGCVVYAGSVVTKSFPEYSIIGGNPAKLIKMRLPESLNYKLDYSLWLAP